MNEFNSPFILRVKGPDVNGVYRLSRFVTVVGRRKSADVEIKESVVAPRHLIIDWDDEHNGHVLRVLGISGVYLNEEYLGSDGDPRMLGEGDEIRIGTTTLVYARAA